MTIALIDDSKVMRSILRKSILMRGLRVERFLEADDGEQGFAVIAANRGRIDLIITDLHMPVCGGLAMLERLHAAGLDAVPIVVVSTMGDEATRQACRALGAVAFLDKPFNHEMLDQVLRQVTKSAAAGANPATPAPRAAERGPAEVGATLKATLEEILDKMAYLYFEQSAAEKAATPFDLRCRISFQGVLHGILDVSLTRASAEALARNLIGIRESDTLHAGTTEDAVREFTNMLIGRTLTALAPARHFALGAPALSAWAPADDPHEPDIRIEGLLEEAPFALWLVLENTPP